MKYNVCLSVCGYFHCDVEANNVEEAKRKAIQSLYNSNISGDSLDAEFAYYEDENGNIAD